MTWMPAFSTCVMSAVRRSNIDDLATATEANLKSATDTREGERVAMLAAEKGALGDHLNS